MGPRLITRGGVGSDWFIAVINGFLVYAAAGGVTGVGASVTGSTVVAKGLVPGPGRSGDSSRLRGPERLLGEGRACVLARRAS